MKYTVGIDLGSTTTKAVVLGLDGRLLGRGITNSRSNYDVACQVALAEALIHTRFSLVAAELAARGVADSAQAALLEALESGIRLRQYLSQLAELGVVIARLGRERGLAPPLRCAAAEVLALMERREHERKASEAEATKCAAFNQRNRIRDDVERLERDLRNLPISRDQQEQEARLKDELERAKAALATAETRLTDAERAHAKARKGL